jgi:conjugative relaxase-like TrwC/TraI family protein
MLAMSKGALTAAQAETYYEEKYSQDDYYSEQHKVVGRWFGHGAEELGLSREVATEDFRAVLRGQQPGSGAVLVPKAHGYSDRRAGWDATFNAPKSISIQALVGEDQRLIGAHGLAVGRALEELEQYALSRRRGGSEWVVTDKLVAARFEHIAARPARDMSDGYGLDPHLHTHVVIANLTRRPDGEWRGLDPIEIYRSQSFATAVYRSELARAVQGLGYHIRVTGSDGRWELEGYTREQVMAFSRRRQDIERGLAQAGLSGAAAAQNLAHQTRRAKDHRDEASLKAEWKFRADEYGIAFKPRWSLARVRSTLQRWKLATPADVLRRSITENTEREAVIDRRMLEAKALQHAMGTLELGQIRKESARLEQEGQLLPVGRMISSPHGAFTTPEMVELERENLTMMRAGQTQARAIGSAIDVRQWAGQRGLSHEQAMAAEVTLTARNWLTSIEGRAGPAKTTTVGVIREFAERQGYAVYGFAPTTRAVKSLQEAGVAAQTVASLLESRSVSRPRASSGRS